MKYRFSSIVWWSYPSPPLDSGFRRSDESGVCFRSNRSCRLAPAHQVMKNWICGLVQRIWTADSATPHPDPCGGQAPRLAKSSTALHSPLPAPLDSGLRRNDEWGAGIDDGMPQMANERLPERSIQDRGPAHAFIAMTRPAGLTGATYFRTNDESGDLFSYQ